MRHSKLNKMVHVILSVIICQLATNRGSYEVLVISSKRKSQPHPCFSVFNIHRNLWVLLKCRFLGSQPAGQGDGPPRFCISQEMLLVGMWMVVWRLCPEIHCTVQSGSQNSPAKYRKLGSLWKYRGRDSKSWGAFPQESVAEERGQWIRNQKGKAPFNSTTSTGPQPSLGLGFL